MSGTPTDNTRAEGRLRGELARLNRLFAENETYRLNYDDFSQEIWNDMMNLYYVATAPDPLAAVVELYRTDAAIAEARERERREFLRIIGEDDRDTINVLLTSMQETLGTLIENNVNIDTGLARGIFDDLMDAEELTPDELTAPVAARGRRRGRTAPTPAPAEEPVKSGAQGEQEMTFEAFLSDVANAGAERREQAAAEVAIADEVHRLMKAKHLANEEKVNRQDREFFEGVNLREDFAPAKVSNCRTLDRSTTRVNFAQMYMLSKGDSLRVILADTPAAQALRKQRGAELMEILHGGTERVGQLFADISAALARHPIPDVSNDAALCRNRDEIFFLYAAGINFSQVMGKQDNIPVRDAYRNAAGENYDRGETAFRRLMLLQTEGIVGRINVMTYEDYSPSIANPDTRDLPNSSRSGALSESDYYLKNKQRINELLQTGVPMGDGPPVDEAEAVRIKVEANEAYLFSGIAGSAQETAQLRETLPKGPEQVALMREALTEVQQSDERLLATEQAVRAANANRRAIYDGVVSSALAAPEGEVGNVSGRIDAEMLLFLMEQPGGQEFMDALDELDRGLKTERTINRDNLFNINAELSKAFKKAMEAGENLVYKHIDEKQQAIKDAKPQILINTKPADLRDLKSRKAAGEALSRKEKKLLLSCEKAENDYANEREAIDKRFKEGDAMIALLGKQVEKMVSNRGFITKTVMEMYDELSSDEAVEFNGKSFEQHMKDRPMNLIDVSDAKGMDEGNVNDVYRVGIGEEDLFVKPGQMKANLKVKSPAALNQLKALGVVGADVGLRDAQESVYKLSNDSAFRDQGQQMVGKLLGVGVITPSRLEMDTKTGLVSAMNVAGGLRADQYIATADEGSMQRANTVVNTVRTQIEEIRQAAPGTKFETNIPSGVVDLRNPSLQKSALELVTLDYICGQWDRHTRNFFIKQNENGEYNITGIDNDSAFPIKPCTRKATEMKSLIPFVTPELREKILALNPDEVANALTGVVDRAKEGATVLSELKNRIIKLQNHVMTVRDVPENELGANTVAELTKHKDAPLNWLSRECNVNRYDSAQREVANAHKKHVTDPALGGGGAERMNTVGGTL